MPKSSASDCSRSKVDTMVCGSMQCSHTSLDTRWDLSCILDEVDAGTVNCIYTNGNKVCTPLTFDGLLLRSPGRLCRHIIFN